MAFHSVSQGDVNHPNTAKDTSGAARLHSGYENERVTRAGTSDRETSWRLQVFYQWLTNTCLPFTSNIGLSPEDIRSWRFFAEIVPQVVHDRIAEIVSTSSVKRITSESHRLWKAASRRLCIPQKKSAWIIVMIVALTMGTVVWPQNPGKVRQRPTDGPRSVDKPAESDWVSQMTRFQASKVQEGACQATESGELFDTFDVVPDVYETDEEVSGDVVRKRVFELEVVGKAKYDVSLHGNCRWLKVDPEKSKRTYKILLPFGADWDIREDSDISLEDGVLTVVARKSGNAD